MQFRVEICKNGCVLEMSTRPEEGFANHYIAWYHGERAGYLCLKFHKIKYVYVSSRRCSVVYENLMMP